jgi:hypothetical protein
MRAALGIHGTFFHGYQLVKILPKNCFSAFPPYFFRFRPLLLFPEIVSGS